MSEGLTQLPYSAIGAVPLMAEKEMDPPNIGVIGKEEQSNRNI